jgi:hypothetical protein
MMGTGVGPVWDLFFFNIDRIVGGGLLLVFLALDGFFLNIDCGFFCLGVFGVFPCLGVFVVFGVFLCLDVFDVFLCRGVFGVFLCLGVFDVFDVGEFGEDNKKVSLGLGNKGMLVYTIKK